MLLVPGLGYRTTVFLFSDVLIDPQRTSFGDKNSDRLAQAGPPPRLLGRLSYWEQKSEREKERERGKGERESRGRAEERKKGKTWHSSVKSASFVCFLGLSFRKENRPGVQKTQNFLVFKLRRLFKSLGLFESVGTYNDV